MLQTPMNYKGSLGGVLSRAQTSTNVARKKAPSLVLKFRGGCAREMHLYHHLTRSERNQERTKTNNKRIEKNNTLCYVTESVAIVFFLFIKK